MRAKIIQYNSTAGTGVASANGQQYDFTIRHWRSDSAPAADQTIDITLEDGVVSAIFVVPTDILAREKASQFANHFSAQLAATRVRSGLATEAFNYLSMPVLAAYTVFVLSATAFNAISVNIFGVKQGVTLWNISDVAGQLGSGGGRFLLILSFASIVVPLAWRDKRAWLAMLFPAVLLVKLGFDIMSAFGQAEAQLGGLLGGFGASMGNAIGNAISIGLGGYGALSAAVILAAFALKRALASSVDIGLGDTAATDSALVRSEPVHPEATPTAAPDGRTGAAICKVCKSPLELRPGSVYCAKCGEKL